MIDLSAWGRQSTLPSVLLLAALRADHDHVRNMLAEVNADSL
jgi:hypothetical protein